MRCVGDSCVVEWRSSLIKQVLRTAVCVPGQVAISRVIRADGTHSRTDLTPATADMGSCPRRVVARHVLGNLVVRMLEGGPTGTHHCPITHWLNRRSQQTTKTSCHFFSFHISRFFVSSVLFF